LTFLIAMVSGSVPARDEVSMTLSMVRSYGNSARGVEGSFANFGHIIVLILAFLMTGQALAQKPAAAPAKPAASPTPQASYAMGDPFSSGQATAYDAYKTGGGQESFNPYASGISNGSDFARRQFGAFK